MRLTLISCEVLFREMCDVVARSPHQIDVQFLPKGLHDLGGKPMADEIQRIIDAVPVESADAILLGYGLCGNGLQGITARHTLLVLPRAHDCIALLMGSRERYLEYFNEHPGTYYRSTGWLERGKGLKQLTHNTVGMDVSLTDMIAKYGDDNGRYLYEELTRYRNTYQRLTYIATGLEPDNRFEEEARWEAAEAGWKFEKMAGDLVLLRRLVNGDWKGGDFLLVQPGERITATYDNSIVRVEEIGKTARGAMTGKERVLARLRGEPTDSLPLMPITMMYAGDLIGQPYRAYATDFRVLAEGQLRTAERFDFDYVSAISDPAREASDLGAAIEWFDNQPPAIIESRALIGDKSRLDTLALPDPEAPGRMQDRVQAVRLLAERAGADKIVQGWVEGPCAMASDLRGLNTLMFDLSDDTAFVEALFDYAVRMEVNFAKAQVAMGATLIGVGDAAASLVGPRLYNQFVQPFEKRLVSEIRAMGVLVELHICGNTRRIVKGMGETGADIIDLDSLTTLAEARAAMKPEQVLLGNIDPVRTLRDGTPDSVEAALTECYAQAGRAYIVGAGCEIPRGTPVENVDAMTRFARSRQ